MRLPIDLTTTRPVGSKSSSLVSRSSASLAEVSRGGDDPDGTLESCERSVSANLRRLAYPLSRLGVGQLARQGGRETSKRDIIEGRCSLCHPLTLLGLVSFDIINWR